MRYLAAAALLCSLAGCGAADALAPDYFEVRYDYGIGGYDGLPPAWSDLEGESQSVGFTFGWDLHRQPSDEIRALRNDMRARAHQLSVEEEAERDRAELIEEAAAAAASVETPEDRGGYDWIYENVEVWAFLLVGILGVLWRVGVWVGKREQQEQKP